ncbi:outer membrane beta-barrel protein [Vibrio caribbeanicus]|uniref:Outer membrane protein beta-barrel domain-containing protein n=1 Tax=Vibrio caribbeanicus ATCC BAA-2122 TaxID=796620 RepID=E3BHI2_9VIBR|nr:outer membrane beta-barrel protein [Vibrio caribbeanicus]EFP97513.1 hypothetical protein VIBC2010_00155 [Vibrio caribbeanicus ATCC BAA-2122]
MKKLLLITTPVLIATAFNASAASSKSSTQNFSYLSGGLQVSKYNHKLPTEVNSADHSPSDTMTGAYLRGSWNFTDNFFLETRGDAVSKNDLTISTGLLGLGYFYPVNDAFTVYGLLGGSSAEVELNLISNGNINYRETGFTGEVGARYQVMSLWTIEPAVRMANYDDNMYEYRLGNIVGLNEHVSLEGNLVHRNYTSDRANNGLKETAYQFGVRYSF